MSSPGDNDPSGTPPYGPPTPYGAPNPYQPSGGPAPLDGISIASLVLSLLCCTGLIGLILGIVGLFRTKDGQRRGRWAAVSGIAVGAFAVVAGAAGTVIFVFVANQAVTPDNAEVGQCVDIKKDDDTVSMTEQDCADEHDGEILYVGEYDPDEHGDELEASVCDSLVPAEVQEAIVAEIDDPDYGMVVENLGEEEAGDSFVCYVAGDDLTGSLQ